MTVKRPIAGTGNREGGQCHEIFVADVVDLNESEGIALITENTVSPDGSTILFARGSSEERWSVLIRHRLIPPHLFGCSMGGAGSDFLVRLDLKS